MAPTFRSASRVAAALSHGPTDPQPLTYTSIENGGVASRVCLRKVGNEAAVRSQSVWGQSPESIRPPRDSMLMHSWTSRNPSAQKPQPLRSRFDIFAEPSSELSQRCLRPGATATERDRLCATNAPSVPRPPASPDPAQKHAWDHFQSPFRMPTAWRQRSGPGPNWR